MAHDVSRPGTMSSRPCRLATALAAALLLALISLSAPLAQESNPQRQAQRIEELERRLDEVVRELQELRSSTKAPAPPADLGERMDAIERKIDILAQELQSLKGAATASGETSTAPTYAASPTPFQEHPHGLLSAGGVSIGGYGEVNAQFRQKADDVGDALRTILYVGYRFNDRIFWSSELEFEHGQTEPNLDGKEGEVALEFSNLTFLINEHFNIRAGLNLVPFGIINEKHEPTTFHGVLRPDVETQIIPSTWREVGIGAFGTVTGGLRYKAYLMTALDSRGFEAGNLREGRSSGNRARFNDAAFVGRLEYTLLQGLELGSSLYIGNTGQGEEVDGKEIGGRLTMWEADYQFQWRGFESRGLVVYTWLDDSALINLNNGLVGDESVGKQMYGLYIEGGYNLLPLLLDTDQSLTPFVRYEQYNTQHKVPSGFASDPANDRKTVTYGIEYKPHHNVVIKMDYQDRRNGAGTAGDQFNLGVGWEF